MTLWSWVALSAVGVWTVVMFVHVGYLWRAVRTEDRAVSDGATRFTMRLVGWWQITLGVAMVFIGPEPQWMAMFPLAAVGVAILILDKIARMFNATI